MALMLCTESFAYTDGRQERSISAGTYVDSTDPAVKLRPASFAPAEATATGPATRAVEQATAAPGEQSTARRAPAKKAAAKK